MGNDSIDLLFAGRAFSDLSFWRKIGVAGADASSWLNSLISADISDLSAGRARRSLLLSPTGKVRAEFTVAVVPGGNLLLIQDPMQPRSILDLLSLYTLSSDVTLEDRTQELALFAFPGRTEPPGAAGAATSAPSCLGPGADVIAPAEDHGFLAAQFSKLATPVGNEDIEAWRIATGLPRVGVDVLEDDLPQEGGLAGAVSFEKGCYLGQEAVAKVQNLGHPRRALLRLEASGPVSPGDPIEADGKEAGEVTSAASLDGRTVLLARVRWSARQHSLQTSGGVELRFVG
jgi:folate-binding protein YgfZ